MEQQLKQRLVGVAVIFSLAIIFVPMLLDGSGNRPQQLNITIPPPPQIATNDHVQEKIIEIRKKVEELPELQPVVVDEASDPPVVEVAKEADQKEAEPPATEQKAQPEPKPKAQTEKVAKVEAAKPKPSPKKQVGGTSWVIQVGSFSDKNKAYKQRDRLRKSKLASVFIEKFAHDGKTSYRVRMGPFITRKKANVVKNKVLAKYNVKGLVMRYEK